MHCDLDVARHMLSGLESLKASKCACFAFVCFVCNSHKIQGLRLMFWFYMSPPNRPCHFLLNLKGGVFERRQLDKFVFLKMRRDFSAPSLDLGEGSPWGSRWLTRRWCGRRRRCDAWAVIFLGIWNKTEFNSHPLSFLKAPPYLLLCPSSSMISGMAEAKRARPTVRKSTWKVKVKTAPGKWKSTMWKWWTSPYKWKWKWKEHQKCAKLFHLEGSAKGGHAVDVTVPDRWHCHLNVDLMWWR